MELTTEDVQWRHKTWDVDLGCGEANKKRHLEKHVYGGVSWLDGAARGAG